MIALSPENELTLIVAAVAAATAIPGVFLVLRRMALVADAMSHTLLFGIVIAYLFVPDVYSPWLMIGAAGSGVLTVLLVEMLQRSNRVKQDAAIGLVFPALFAIGTIIASVYFRQTHLDIDQVLLGQVELAPDFRFRGADGTDYGPKPLIVMLVALGMNLLFVLLLFKELKLTTFDAGLAATLGFLPGLLQLGLMSVVSLTTVAAFDAVGPVLVVAFLVLPAATARLLTRRLSVLLIVSAVIGILGAIVGVRLAFALETTIGGTTASVLGLTFLATYVLSPQHGILIKTLRSERQRRQLPEILLTVHLRQHEGTPAEADESQLAGLHEHLEWSRDRVGQIVARATARGWVAVRGDRLTLTDEGRSIANDILRLT